MSMELDIGNIPGHTVFLWQDGALFDEAMNAYMSVDWPLGINPSNPLAIMQSNGLGSNATLTLGNSSTTIGSAVTDS